MVDFAKEAEDPFNSDEEKRILLQLDSLEKQAHIGALFEDLYRHPAWHKVEEYMDNFIEQSQKKIFGDPDGDHKKIIFQVQGMVTLKNWINAQRLAGQIASKTIADHLKTVQQEKEQLGIE